MSVGRRKVRLEDAGSWVFNRMVGAYRARPAYPDALIDAIASLGGARPALVVDVGAGIGHVALPLAARGHTVVAVEPAVEMLDVLRAEASRCGLPVRAVHGTAEALPLDSASADMAVVADALHFLDVELTAAELARVLAPGGRLAIVTCELDETPFMRSVVAIMEASAPRRPRAVSPPISQVFEILGAAPPRRSTFTDATALDRTTLERVLASISFIGPAMNEARTRAFRQKIHAIEEPAVWARRFTLHAGTRARPRGPRGGVRRPGSGHVS